MTTNETSSLWLIPARGGSKGVPNKNIRPLCGKSLVARAIENAFESARPEDTIYVSTDSLEIAREAENYGLEIPFMRPRSLAEDKTSTYDVIIHTLNEFAKRGKTFDKVILLQPTSPFRTTEDIQRVIAAWSPDIDMSVSVVSAATNPYYNAFEEDDAGFLKISKGEGNISRRQDAPEVWEYNGAVYVMTVSSLLKRPYSEFEKIVGVPMSEENSLDIDSPLDWKIAEFLLSN